jgi:hypothetical protein
MTYRDAVYGGRLPSRSPVMLGPTLWREIAIGLVVAIIGILLAFSVIWGGVSQSHTARPAAGLRVNPATSGAG